MARFEDLSEYRYFGKPAFFAPPETISGSHFTWRKQTRRSADEVPPRAESSKRPGAQHLDLAAAMLAIDAPFAEVFAVVGQGSVAGLAET